MELDTLQVIRHRILSDDEYIYTINKQVAKVLKKLVPDLQLYTLRMLLRL